MKLRQKLAVVLATAMVVTAVPVVTMADTSNKIVSSVRVIEKDDKTTGAALRIKFEDANVNEEEEFYFTLTNANWLKGDNDEDIAIIEGLENIEVESKNVWKLTPGEYSTDDSSATVTYERQSDKVLKVNVKGVDKDDVINFTLPIKATGGDVSVALTGEGSSSTITEGNYKLLSTGEKAASLTVGDLNAFYDNGTLSDITLKETFLNSFGAKDMIIKIKLEDTDFEFLKSSDVTIEGSYGFNFKYTVADSSKVQFDIDEDDKSVAYLWISKDVAAAAKSQGRIKITGIKVDSEEKDLTLGDLLADITTVDSLSKDDTLSGKAYTGGAQLDKDYTDTALAKIADYGAYVKMKDEKAIDVVAGRDEEVTFEVIESVDDVFVGSRTITLGLKDDKDATDKSFFMISDEQKDNPLAKLLDNDDSRKIVEKIEYVWKDDADLKNTYWTGKGMYRATAIKVTLKDKKDGDSDGLNKNDSIDKFKVKTKVYVPVGQQDKKTIEITGEVRGVDEFKSATAVNVIDPFDVVFDQTTFKVGLQDQLAGKIAVTEKDKEMLMKGDLILNIVNGSKKTDGIVIEEKGDLTVTGDLKKADLGTDGNQADKITLKRQSKAASTLTIENMEVTVDRTIPEGFYDLKLSGSAIDEYDGSYTIDDYIVIGTKNTEEINTTNGLAKGTATFVIGESKYTLNGVEATMDAAPYIQDPGYTMVPVRYVAEAFGVAQSDILFGNGSVIIIAGNRTVQLTNGSNVAIVNGASVTMSTKVVIKDGRTYAPIGEIAKILGVASTWDNTAKTATFTN